MRNTEAPVSLLILAILTPRSGAVKAASLAIWVTVCSKQNGFK